VSYRSSTDQTFLATLELWIREQSEILVLIRYSHAAGSKDFELFTSFEALADRMRRLPPQTCVIAFRQRQLPIRGVLDEELITKCLSGIPDGSEFLILETVRKNYGRAGWFHHVAGESHPELREELAELKGSPVAVGPYPLWLNDSEDVISAVVPDEHGAVKSGVY